LIRFLFQEKQYCWRSLSHKQPKHLHSPVGQTEYPLPAECKQDANQARNAMLDYDAYFKAVNGQVNDMFYYYREQAAGLPLLALPYKSGLSDSVRSPWQYHPMHVDTGVLSGHPQPVTSAFAPYLLERAQMNLNANQARNAMLDYDAYFKAVNGQVNDVFYYYREQAALKARQYQRALDDIAKAIELNPKDLTYKAEQAYFGSSFNILFNI